MSVDLDLDDDALSFGIEDVKPSAVTRMLKHLVVRAAKRRKMRSQRDTVMDPSDEPDDALMEMEKNSSLHSEKRGSPAPIRAKEDDFASGDVRRALKVVPKGARKKRG